MIDGVSLFIGAAYLGLGLAAFVGVLVLVNTVRLWWLRRG